MSSRSPSPDRALKELSSHRHHHPGGYPGEAPPLPGELAPASCLAPTTRFQGLRKREPWEGWPRAGVRQAPRFPRELMYALASLRCGQSSSEPAVLCRESWGLPLLRECLLQDLKAPKACALPAPALLLLATSTKPSGNHLCFQPTLLAKVVNSQHLPSPLCSSGPNPPPLRFRQCGVWVGLEVLTSSEQAQSPDPFPSPLLPHL